MLIIDIEEVKLAGEAKQNNLPPECGQLIGGWSLFCLIGYVNVIRSHISLYVNLDLHFNGKFKKIQKFFTAYPCSVFSTQGKKGTPPLFPGKRMSAPLFFFLENDPQAILSTSKYFKMTPYAIKMHLESIKLH
jgi:hypothetical protein